MLPVGLVQFEIGEYAKTVKLAIPNDDDYQASAGNITLTLTSATSSQFATPAQAKIKVIDDYDAGRLSFQDTSLYVNEDAQTARIFLIRDRGTAGFVTTRLASTVSAFVVGSQFQAIATFESGQTLTFVDIPLRSSSEYAFGSFD